MGGFISKMLQFMRPRPSDMQARAQAQTARDRQRISEEYLGVGSEDEEGVAEARQADIVEIFEFMQAKWPWPPSINEAHGFEIYSEISMNVIASALKDTTFSLMYYYGAYWYLCTMSPTFQNASSIRYDLGPTMENLPYLSRYICMMEVPTFKAACAGALMKEPLLDVFVRSHTVVASKQLMAALGARMAHNNLNRQVKNIDYCNNNRRDDAQIDKDLADICATRLAPASAPTAPAAVTAAPASVASSAPASAAQADTEATELMIQFDLDRNVESLQKNVKLVREYLAFMNCPDEYLPADVEHVQFTAPSDVAIMLWPALRWLANPKDAEGQPMVPFDREKYDLAVHDIPPLIQRIKQMGKPILPGASYAVFDYKVDPRMAKVLSDAAYRAMSPEELREAYQDALGVVRGEAKSVQTNAQAQANVQQFVGRPEAKKEFSEDFLDSLKPLGWRFRGGGRRCRTRHRRTRRARRASRRQKRRRPARR